jgi:hypothetical protein
MSTLKRLSISNPNNIQFKYAYMGDGPYDFSGLPFRKAYWKKIFIRSPHLNVLHSCNNTGYQTYNTDISEVISAEYLDRYNYHVVQDNGGLLWGPVIWRNSLPILSMMSPITPTIS